MEDVNAADIDAGVQPGEGPRPGITRTLQVAYTQIFERIKNHNEAAQDQMGSQLETHKLSLQRNYGTDKLTGKL